MTVVVNEPALQNLLHDPGGDLALWLNRLGFEGESLAKLNASGRPGPMVRTGRLRASISHRVAQDGKGLFCDVGTSVFYARYLEPSPGQVGLRNGARYPFLEPAVRALTGF